MSIAQLKELLQVAVVQLKYLEQGLVQMKGEGGQMWWLVTWHANASNFILGATPLEKEIIGWNLFGCVTIYPIFGVFKKNGPQSVAIFRCQRKKEKYCI